MELFYIPSPRFHILAIPHTTFSPPALSIIIPTHKRADFLRRALEHLEKQTIKDQIEVIVVSDGHDPATADLFKHSTFDLPHSTFLEIPKSHQGIARNRGVEKAKANIVLFSQDDIFLGERACESHLLRHSKPETRNAKPFAVLGFTTWDPTLQITPVMAWLEDNGWQFGYPLIEKYKHAFVPHSLQHRFTYTSNISVPTAVARQFPFREDVSLYGWEDIEWGMRLRKADVKLFYEPNAHAYHHHHMTLEASLKRMETLGESAVHLSRIAPELDRLPKGWKLAAYQVLSLIPSMRGRHAKAFLNGIRRTK